MFHSAYVPQTCSSVPMFPSPYVHPTTCSPPVPIIPSPIPQKCFPFPMFHKHVPQYRYSPVPMFLQLVPQSLCSPVLFHRSFCHSLCFPHMFPSAYVPQTCSPVPMFPQLVHQFLCSPVRISLTIHTMSIFWVDTIYATMYSCVHFHEDWRGSLLNLGWYPFGESCSYIFYKNSDYCIPKDNDWGT